MSARAQPSSGAPARAEGALELRLLGPLELRWQGETLPLGGARQRALLALLGLERGAVVSVDEIVDKLWGASPPASARHMVVVYVSRLRKLLGPGLLLTRAPGYRLDLDPESLDVARFERLLAEGSEALASAEPDFASACLGEALSLWRGQALADFAYEPFAQAEIARLQELRQLTEEERVEAELALGRAAELVSEIDSLVAAQPLRERRHGQLMLALYRAGRQADALAAYKRARETLVEELGVEPGQALRELERAILNQEEAELGPSPLGRIGVESAARLKLVTVLIAELAEHQAGVDTERFSHEVERLGTSAHATLVSHGASATQLPGAMLMGVFGNPVSHEDDPLRAIRAAICLRDQGVGAIGICTGETLVRAGSISGPAVGSARRLAERGANGAVILDDMTRHLLSDAVSVEPLDVEHAVWRLLELDETALSKRLLLDAPLTGREQELATLEELLARTIDESHAHLVTLVGEPGIGKSRLAYEFAGRIAVQARFLVGHCVSFGDGITYWPLRDVLRELGAEETGTLIALLPDDDEAVAVADRLASLRAAAEMAYPREEIQWAAQRLFAGLARQRPLLLFVEDVHWAEPTFLELIGHAVEVTDAPLLVLCAARPELYETWPDWRGAETRANTVVLEALDEGESGELLSALGSGRRLTPDERSDVIVTAEGNPLFLEQLSALLSDQGQGFRSTGSIPASAQALLAARLDQLGPGELDVLERGSVVGREFGRAVVHELLPARGRRTLDRHLDVLVKRRFILADESAPPFEHAFRFRHVLLQEAAYRRIPKGARAALHEQVANLFLRSPRLSPADEDELVGYHLEQAFQYRLDLGAEERDVIELAARAGTHLAAAGSRASLRGDLAAAVKLLDRAGRLLPRGEPQRIGALLELGSALGPLGDAEKARTVLDEVVETAGATGDRVSQWLARLERADLEGSFDPDSVSYAELLEKARQATAECERLGSERGLTRAWRAQTQALFWMGKTDAAAVAAEKTIQFAEGAGDTHQRALAMGDLVGSLLDGSTHALHAIRRSEALLERAGDDRMVVAHIQRKLAMLHSMRGSKVEAWGLVESSVKTYEDLGITLGLASALGFERAALYMANDDFAAAERDQRSAVQLLQEIGEKGLLSTLSALLAATLCLRGEDEEAEQFVEVSEASAGKHDWVSHMCAKDVRAELHARRGELEDALSLCRQALAEVEPTDNIERKGWQRMRLAKLLASAVRPGQAAPLLREARQLFEAKGHLVGTDLAEAELRALDGARALAKPAP